MNCFSALIAIVDDDEADRLATRRAFQRAAIDNEVIEAADGEAFFALIDERRESGLRMPDLILLDLNMPVLDGHGVMERLSRAPELANIPVVVLTVSDHPDDIRRSYLEGAASYVAKPVTLAGIARVIAGLNGYALTILRES